MKKQSVDIKLDKRKSAVHVAVWEIPENFKKIPGIKVKLHDINSCQ